MKFKLLLFQIFQGSSDERRACDKFHDHSVDDRANGNLRDNLQILRGAKPTKSRDKHGYRIQVPAHGK